MILHVLQALHHQSFIIFLGVTQSTKFIFNNSTCVSVTSTTNQHNAGPLSNHGPKKALTCSPCVFPVPALVTSLLIPSFGNCCAPGPFCPSIHRPLKGLFKSCNSQSIQIIFLKAPSWCPKSCTSDLSIMKSTIRHSHVLHPSGRPGKIYMILSKCFKIYLIASNRQRWIPFAYVCRGSMLSPDHRFP